MTNCKSIYLYYHKEISEPDTWDFKFSYFLGMIFNQITGIEVKILSNLDVSGAKLLKVNYLDIDRVDALIIIQNTIDQFSGSIDNLISISENFKGFPAEKIYQVIKKGSLSLSENSFISNFQQYRFFELNHRTIQILEYDPDVLGDSEVGFWEKLSDLAYDIKLVNSNHSERNNRDNTIYLAEVSDDQIKNREKIKRELLLLGYRIIPISPLPKKLEDFENTVAAHLSESILSINILGELYGESPKMVDYSYVEIQNRIFEKEFVAQKKSPIEPKMHRILWTQPVFDTSDDKQLQYIKRLQKEILSVQNTEQVQSSISDLIEIIEKKIRQIKTEGFEFIEEEHKSNINIIYDLLEEENLKIIRTKLDNEKLTHQFYDINNMQVGTTNELLQEFKYKHNFLIINALKSHSWITSLIALIIRSKGLAGAQPLLSIIVLSTDIEKDFKYLAPIEVQLMQLSLYKFEDQFNTILSILKI
jgi:hypothetical protein